MNDWLMSCWSNKNIVDIINSHNTGDRYVESMEQKVKRSSMILKEIASCRSSVGG